MKWCNGSCGERGRKTTYTAHMLFVVALWKARNNCQFQQGRAHDFQVTQRAWEEWNEFEHLYLQQDEQSKNETRITNSMVRAPHPEAVIISVGAATSLQKNRTGHGIIARSWKHNVR